MTDGHEQQMRSKQQQQQQPLYIHTYVNADK